MADYDNTPRQGQTVTDKRGNVPLTEVTNAGTVAALKARLTALNGTSYTAARLNSMTKNDMLYALRVESADAAGI